MQKQEITSDIPSQTWHMNNLFRNTAESDKRSVFPEASAVYASVGTSELCTNCEKIAMGLNLAQEKTKNLEAEKAQVVDTAKNLQVHIGSLEAERFVLKDWIHQITKYWKFLNKELPQLCHDEIEEKIDQLAAQMPNISAETVTMLRQLAKIEAILTHMQALEESYEQHKTAPQVVSDSAKGKNAATVLA